jgi:hypothetical protein
MLLPSLNMEAEEFCILEEHYCMQYPRRVTQRLLLEVRYEPNGKPPQRSGVS